MSNYSKALKERRELELKLLIESVLRATAGGEYGNRDYYARILTRKLAYYGYVVDKDYALHPRNAYGKLLKDQDTVKELQAELDTVRKMKIG